MGKGNEIVVKITKDKTAKISITYDGIQIPGVKNFNLNFDGSQLKFSGERLKTDRKNEFFVDDAGNTASEKIDYLNYLDSNFKIFQFTQHQEKTIDFNLHNIFETSKLNAKNYIKERKCKV